MIDRSSFSYKSITLYLSQSTIQNNCGKECEKMCGPESIDIDFASLLEKHIHFVPLIFWLRLAIYIVFFIDFK